jgi:hypothetical protein
MADQMPINQVAQGIPLAPAVAPVYQGGIPGIAVPIAAPGVGVAAPIAAPIAAPRLPVAPLVIPQVYRNFCEFLQRPFKRPIAPQSSSGRL